MTKENRQMKSFRLSAATVYRLSRLSEELSLGQGQLIDIAIGFIDNALDDEKRWRELERSEWDKDILRSGNVRYLIQQLND